MNRIDRILQAAVLPDVPVESLPEARQAGILNGTMQLVQQDAKKHGRKRVIRIMIAAAAAIAVLCGAAAALRFRLQCGDHVSCRGRIHSSGWHAGAVFL